MKKLFILFILSSFYSFSQDSLNVQKPKLSVIELEKIKVVYRGIENPISIAVPKNVKSFTVSGDGVSATEVVGKYIVRPRTGKEMTIKVEMILQDNSIIIEEHFYEIKSFEAPISTINDFYNYRGEILKLTMNELKNTIIGVSFRTCYNIKAEVTQFCFKAPGKPTITITGNTFTNDVYELLKKSKKNDEFVVFDIKCKVYGVSMLMKSVSPSSFKIVEEEKYEID